MHRKASDCIVRAVPGRAVLGTYEDRNILVVDRRVTEIKIDAVYVLSLNDELYVKRLQRRQDGAVTMISGDKAYEPHIIENSEDASFQVLGRASLVKRDLVRGALNRRSDTCNDLFVQPS